MNKYVPTYGNWGGPGYSGGRRPKHIVRRDRTLAQPVDEFDEAFMEHDFDYEAEDYLTGDRRLVEKLQELHPRAFSYPWAAKLVFTAMTKARELGLLDPGVESNPGPKGRLKDRLAHKPWNREEPALLPAPLASATWLANSATKTWVSGAVGDIWTGGTTSSVALNSVLPHEIPALAVWAVRPLVQSASSYLVMLSVQFIYTVSTYYGVTLSVYNEAGTLVKARTLYCNHLQWPLSTYKASLHATLPVTLPPGWSIGAYLVSAPGTGGDFNADSSACSFTLIQLGTGSRGGATVWPGLEDVASPLPTGYVHVDPFDSESDESEDDLENLLFPVTVSDQV